MNDVAEQKVYGTKEAASQIGIAATTLRKLAQKGYARGKKRGFGVTSDWQFTQDEVNRLREAYAPPLPASVA